jgi:hypothetical protein
MSNPQLERFLKDLRDSAVIPESDLLPLAERFEDGDPKGLALALVQAGLLTDWQAKFILSGRNRLRVGNYLLQERLRRDELGDCFLAWHEPLHRQVRLQILPETVTRQSPTFQAVTNLVGQMTALDHPRVEHIFDLGEEGGRLFVVFEQALGQRLDVRGLITLTQREAAGLLQGISAALAVLHARGLGHGEVAATGLLLEPTGEGKLVGLCEASLRRVLSPNAMLPKEEWLRLDRREWKELAERILVRQFRAPEFDAWRKLADRLADDPSALVDLAERVEDWQRDLQASAGASDLGLEPEEAKFGEPASVRLEPDLATEKVANIGANRQGKRAPGVGNVRTSRESSSLTTKKVERRNPWLRLYSLVVAVVAAVGLLGYVLWRLLPGDGLPSSAASNTDAAKTSVALGKSTEDAVTAKSPALGLEKKAAREDVAASRPAGKSELPLADGEQPGSETLPGSANPQGKGENEPLAGGGAGQPAQLSSESALRAPGSGLASEVELASETPATSTGKVKQEKDPFQIPGKKSETPPSGEMEKQPPANSTEGAAQVAGLPANQPSGATLKTPPVVDLSRFPAVVNLGLPGEEERPLGPIANLAAEQITLQLLYDPETVAKSRIVFELQPLPAKSAWTVVSRKRSGDPESQEVGEFRLVDGRLYFRWAATVDAKSSSLSLCNCLLQIEPQSGVPTTTVLREPILIDGFKLDEKTLKAEGKFDLPAAPNSDNIGIVFGPFPQQGAWAETLVLNENFEERQPAVLVFRPVPNEQLFGLAFERRWRGQAELTAVWSVQGPESPNKPGPSWLPVRQTEFDNIVNATTQAYTQSVSNSELATRASEDAPFGSKTKMRNLATEAKNSMLQLKARHELMGVHQEKLTAIRSSGIPLRVVYQTAEREIILAETPAVREAISAVEAENRQPPEKDKRNDAKGMK